MSTFLKILNVASIPNCYRYVSDVQFLRSPKIPVAIQGVRVSILLDTGAEISILSTQFVQDLFPNIELSRRFRAIRNLGGGLVPVQGPIKLTIEVCGLVLKHPFFYYEGNPTFLMGIDLLTRAALTIVSYDALGPSTCFNVISTKTWQMQLSHPRYM